MSVLRLDEDIKKDVVDQLYWDNRVNAANVNVEVDDGIVTLKGDVPTYKSRVSAAKDARMIAGVEYVYNKLNVTFPSVITRPSDEELETRAKNSLYWHFDIDSAEIQVRVNDGVATLTGNVDRYWKKWEVEQIVSNIFGISAIENHLTIVSTESLLDKDIAEDIEKALERNRYIDVADITVKVEHGRVTLTGVVPNWFVRTQAENVSAYSAGVLDVENNIEVKTE